MKDPTVKHFLKLDVPFDQLVIKDQKIEPLKEAILLVRALFMQIG
ncbi:hypothetical protein VCRA2127O344_20250 [Vibrio crassostreae]|nr:hypothetical protein VCRA2127O344_20250 [Vibrio crassostreae]